tara:strand:+ start:245 stop:481 length:237 start_codon:yes stop_codon:yes gene_type:complete
MIINLDNYNLNLKEKNIILDNILEPIIKKIVKANKLIKERIDILGLEEEEALKLYSNFKLNIKKLEINFDKKNLIKII